MSETDSYLQKMVKDLVKEKNLGRESGKELEEWIKTGTQKGDIKQPKNLVGGTLKDYQVIGLNWLIIILTRSQNKRFKYPRQTTIRCKLQPRLSCQVLGHLSSLQTGWYNCLNSPP
jgi:hypothetical protein